MNYLSSNIRYLRRKTGQNQAELARNFGKKQNTLGNWENGVSEPSIKELVVLSQIFMVGMEELVNKNMEQRDSQGEVVDPPLRDGSPQTGQASLPPGAQEKEMDGFWMTMRELRRMNQKLDILIGGRGLEDGQSAT